MIIVTIKFTIAILRITIAACRRGTTRDPNKRTRMVERHDRK